MTGFPYTTIQGRGVGMAGYSPFPRLCYACKTRRHSRHGLVRLIRYMPGGIQLTKLVPCDCNNSSCYNS